MTDRDDFRPNPQFAPAAATRVSPFTGEERPSRNAALERRVDEQSELIARLRFELGQMTNIQRVASEANVVLESTIAELRSALIMRESDILGLTKRAAVAEEALRDAEARITRGDIAPQVDLGRANDFGSEAEPAATCGRPSARLAFGAEGRGEVGPLRVHVRKG